MNEKEFKKWLNQEYDYAKATVSNRISNVKKVNKFYNLDEIYDRGECSKLINLLNYTSIDKKKGLNAKHIITIDGDLYNGSATLKNATSLYFEFRDSLKENSSNLSIDEKEIENFDSLMFDILRKLKYNKTFYKNISIFQNLFFEKLSEQITEYTWEYEFKISQNYRDRIDIYGYNKSTDHHYVIELDPHRSDSIAKKFVSRIALLNNKKLTYMSICYNGTEKMNKNECFKYFNYCDIIAKSLNIKYFGEML